jgi:hypothetical protein
MTPGSYVWLAVDGCIGPAMVYWRSSAVVECPAAKPGSAAKLAISGDLVAADATIAGAGSLEIADVIYHPGGSSCTQPLTWLVDTLDRYPGCAVAAIPAGECRYVTASRTGSPLTLYGQNDPGFQGLLSAMFVYAWLAAGWPPQELDHHRPLASPALRPNPVALVSFSMFHLGPTPPRGPYCQCALT